MSIPKILRSIFHSSNKKKTASLAKERLQIIISHERVERDGVGYLPQLQKELIAVITKYVDIDPAAIKVALDKQGNNAVLELNVTLPAIKKEVAA